MGVSDRPPSKPEAAKRETSPIWSLVEFFAAVPIGIALDLRFIEFLPLSILLMLGSYGLAVWWKR
jgi:hypothetical protein